jgi:hypothetical protein
MERRGQLRNIQTGGQRQYLHRECHDRWFASLVYDKNWDRTDTIRRSAGETS